jgi:hypothetical protein
MKGNRLIILGVVAAVIMAVSATATTFAFDSRFEKLDWTKYGDQAYGYVRAAPNTGDGASAGNDTAREWLIIGLAAVGAVTAGGVSLTLLRRRQN